MPDEAYAKIQVGGPRAKRRGIALVDRADAEAIGSYRWHMSAWGYVVRNMQVGGKWLTVFMHREILGLSPGDGIQVDHVNGDRLDNRRESLRIATNAQNAQNLHSRPRRGTTWNTQAKRWQAQASLKQKYHYLGLYDTQEEAAAVASAFRREHMPYSRDAREAREMVKTPQIAAKSLPAVD